MLLKDVKIGKQIELIIQRDGYNYRVISKVEAVDDGKLYIGLIASPKRIFEFLDSDIVSLTYRDNDRMWKWNNVKGSIEELDGEKFHCLSSLEQGESFNRRNAYRVHIMENVTLEYRVAAEDPSSSDDIDELYKISTCACMLHDISEVGVGLYTNELLGLDTAVTFDFPSEFGPIKCYGTVIRFYECSYGKYKYYYGCEFTETSKKLTKFIYEKQRREIQRTKERLIW